MEVRIINCDVCKKKIDEMLAYEPRMPKQLNEIEIWDKPSKKRKEFIMRKSICDKCYKKIKKSLKKTFKEYGIKLEFEEDKKEEGVIPGR